MAHLWMRDTTEHLIEVALDAEGATLAAGLPLVRPGRLDLKAPTGAYAWLLPALVARGDTWVLITAAVPGLLVNGAAMPAGIRVLDSRDEIRGPDGRVIVFSDEQMARVAPFPGADHPVRCGRCTCEIEPATGAVRCPACGSWYHEQGDFPCWTSVPFCQACGHATGLAGDDRWTPEES